MKSGEKTYVKNIKMIQK